MIEERGFIPQDLLATEVEWFYESLGIEESYWKTQSIDTIADHIEVRRWARMFHLVSTRTECGRA